MRFLDQELSYSLSLLVLWQQMLFKQFVISVDSYAATNPFLTVDDISVMCCNLYYAT